MVDTVRTMKTVCSNVVMQQFAAGAIVKINALITTCIQIKSTFAMVHNAPLIIIATRNAVIKRDVELAIAEI